MALLRLVPASHRSSRLALLLLIAAGCHHVPARSDDARVGCFELEVGPWSSSGWGRLLPSAIALDTLPVNEKWYHDGIRRRLVRPDMPGHTRGDFDPSWHADAADSLHLIWSTGFHGVRLTLGPERDGSRRGTAAAFADRVGPGITYPVAPVTARRENCRRLGLAP